MSLINTSVLCPPPPCGSEALGFFLVFGSLIDLNMHQHLPSPPGPVHFWSLWLLSNTLFLEPASTSLLLSSNTKCCGQQLSPKVVCCLLRWTPCKWLQLCAVFPCDKLYSQEFYLPMAHSEGLLLRSGRAYFTQLSM